MAKTLAGLASRPGKTIRIGDNRYGLREDYDSEVDASTKETYKRGDVVVVREVPMRKTQ